METAFSTMSNYHSPDIYSNDYLATTWNRITKETGAVTSVTVSVKCFSLTGRFTRVAGSTIKSMAEELSISQMAMFTMASGNMELSMDKATSTLE